MARRLRPPRLSRGALRLRASYDDLSSSGSLFTDFHLRTDGRDFVVDVERWRSGGRAEAFLTLEPQWPDQDEVGECGSFTVVSFDRPCPGIDVSIRPGRDLVEATVPRSCVGTPRWVRLAASSYGVRKGVDYNDRWVPPGRTEGWIVGPYGPRLKAGPRPSDVAAPPRASRVVGGERREVVVTASGVMRRGR